MTRLLKLFAVAGLSSVYLMQAPCTMGAHGFSVVPNGLIPNPFAGLTNTLLGFLPF